MNSILNVISSHWKLASILTVGVSTFVFFYYWVFTDFFNGASPFGINGEWGRRIQEGEESKVYQEIFRFIIIYIPLIFLIIMLILDYMRSTSGTSHMGGHM